MHDESVHFRHYICLNATLNNLAVWTAIVFMLFFIYCLTFKDVKATFSFVLLLEIWKERNVLMGWVSLTLKLFSRLSGSDNALKNSFEGQATGREAMVASFYHEGYEDPLLMLIRRRGVDAGLVIKVCVAVLWFPTCVGLWSTWHFNNRYLATLHYNSSKVIKLRTFKKREFPL